MEVIAGETASGAAAAQTPDVRLQNVTKDFAGFKAVNDLTLDIPRGAFFAMLGPSGCGKTTTLRIIGGFEQPTTGVVHLGDREVTSLPPYKRDVNTVFQSYALFPHLSVQDNVAFGLKERRVAKAELRRRVGEVLELTALTGFEKRKPKQLSGGQQQRVALARALVNRPRVLLLDEPLGALDMKLRKQMQLELKRIHEEVGITFVHVTHDQEEAMTMADTIAVMNRGVIEQLGAPNDLYERPRTTFVAGFLGISNLIRGTVDGPDSVRTPDGTVVHIPAGRLDGRTGEVALGVRPEKLSLAPGDRLANSVEGTITERAYIGVATQYVLDTPSGRVDVYEQNRSDGSYSAQTGETMRVYWDPSVTFVVDDTGLPDEEEG